MGEFPSPASAAPYAVRVRPQSTFSSRESRFRHENDVKREGGMLAATIIAIFYIPLFFVLTSRLFERKKVVAGPTGIGGALSP